MCFTHFKALEAALPSNLLKEEDLVDS